MVIKWFVKGGGFMKFKMKRWLSQVGIQWIIAGVLFFADKQFANQSFKSIIFFGMILLLFLDYNLAKRNMYIDMEREYPDYVRKKILFKYSYWEWKVWFMQEKNEFFKKIGHEVFIVNGTIIAGFALLSFISKM